jgi:hypothetical protein
MMLKKYQNFMRKLSHSDHRGAPCNRLGQEWEKGKVGKRPNKKRRNEKRRNGKKAKQEKAK